jgi:Secretion system C-terminal sorting domain
MKKFITSFIAFLLTCFSYSIFAQTTITIGGDGNGGCYLSNDMVTQNGTTVIGGITRNTYTGTTNANGFTYAIRVIYVATSGGRWELQSFIANAWVDDFFSTVQSAPKAPNYAFGNWQDNTGGICGNILGFSGTGTQNFLTLPIELTQFDANTEGSKNHLTWRTESEKNNKHFDIERSTDGTTFHNIGQVKGNNKPSSYQFVDNQPFATTYYRLRQMDNDGTETYSKIVSVVQTGKGKGLAVYPNPVSSLLNVVYTEGSFFQILNLLGQQVLTGKTAAQVDVSALPQGSYILKVGAEQAKFLKQ